MIHAVLADFHEGKVDVLIGTHAILSRDVSRGARSCDPRRDPRFGVAQKILLSLVASSNDVLTLIATPIPRSFAHFALSTARHLDHRTPP